MHELSELIFRDMKPALGVTEPGAIAFCVATARKLLPGELKHLTVSMNSGMYKNAFTCGIPHSRQVGAMYAAALGYAAGNPDRGLEVLADVTEADNAAAEEYVRAGRITTCISGMSSRIYIHAALETTEGTAEVTIRNSHTNITRIVVNGEECLRTPGEDEDQICPEGNERTTAAGKNLSNSIGKDRANKEGQNQTTAAGKDQTDTVSPVHRYTLREMIEYTETVPLEEIAFTEEAYRMNLALFHEGLKNPRTVFARRLLALNGGQEISEDERRTASLLCNAAIEARVIGLDLPAMSITGSGAHGIIATLPLYAVQQIHGLSRERLCRATMLSYLVCTYIKEYSGRLSAFCGCGIAAGTGMALAVCRMKGGDYEALCRTLNNMASSITGMICDGGNQGCVMKGVAACGAAFDSVELALGEAGINPVHGINGLIPEETMRNMGLIASPGMIGTETTIVKIQSAKRVNGDGSR